MFRVVLTISTGFQNLFITPERNPILISSHFPFPLHCLAPGNHLFTLHLSGFAYSEHFIYNGMLIFLYIILPTIVQGRPVFTPILQIYKGSSCFNDLSVNLNPASHLNSITLCCVPIIKNNYTKIWEREW